MRATGTCLLSLMLASACTSIRVDRVQPDVLRDMRRVCIERNPRVIVRDFLPVVQDGFRRHGIESAAYDPPLPSDCQFVLNYTARQSWDLVNYLKYAPHCGCTAHRRQSASHARPSWFDAPWRDSFSRGSPHASTSSSESVLSHRKPPMPPEP